MQNFLIEDVHLFMPSNKTECHICFEKVTDLDLHIRTKHAYCESCDERLHLTNMGKIMICQNPNCDKYGALTENWFEM